jgi:hypothetical protein
MLNQAQVLELRLDPFLNVLVFYVSELAIALLGDAICPPGFWLLRDTSAPPESAEGQPLIQIMDLHLLECLFCILDL